jgi:hypothetical protein
MKRFLTVLTPRFVFSVIAAASVAYQADAALYSIADGGSIATYDSTSGSLTRWSIDGQNQLSSQSLWLRIGPGLNYQLTAPTSIVQPIAGQLTATYSGVGFNVSVRYNMTDMGPGSGLLAQSIRINNTSGVALNNVSFFTYSDFDLGGNPFNDSAILATDSATGRYVSASQYKGPIALNTTTADTTLSPRADGGEVDLVPFTLGRIGSGAYDLNNISAMNGGPGGNIAWALEWNFASIAAGGSAGIGEQNLINGVLVPEPSTLALVSVGLAAIAIRRQRKAS